MRRRIREELHRARALFGEVFVHDSTAYRDMRTIFEQGAQTAAALRSGLPDRSSTLIGRGVHLYFNRMMPEVPQGAELGFIWGTRSLLGWIVHTQDDRVFRGERSHVRG